MSDDWQMPRHGEACEACRRSFEPGEKIQARLCEAPEGYERRDYCARCQPQAEIATIGTWWTHRPQPADKRVPAFDREAIYGFFEQLEGADTSEKQQLRFVLALLLWRKKVLKFDRSETRDDGEVWRFAAPASGTEHAVERPELAEDELERLGGQLEGLLTGEMGELSAITSDAHEDPADA